MLFDYFIGVDVSKKWLDFAFVTAGQVRCHLQVENTVVGIKQALKSLQAQGKVPLRQALFCVEHTGLYQNTLLAYLSKQQAHIWLESALHIKAGGGLQRGKTDKVDASRIALYAFAYQSGSSVKGKTKVSPKADKKLKRLLHLAALTAIRIKGELQDYYHRKVEQGKHKMSVLNAIRNKLVHRMFAVVQKNRKYEKIYPVPLAPVIEI